MDLKVNSAQPNFKAKMVLRGNIKLLKNGEVEVLKHGIDKIGTKRDLIVINISKNFDKAISIKGYFNDEQPKERFAKVHYSFEIFPDTAGYGGSSDDCRADACGFKFGGICQRVRRRGGFCRSCNRCNDIALTCNYSSAA